jgi:hypothetical protein
MKMKLSRRILPLREREREQEAALGRRQASKQQEHYAAWNGGELLPLERSVQPSLKVRLCAIIGTRKLTNLCEICNSLV